MKKLVIMLMTALTVLAASASSFYQANVTDVRMIFVPLLKTCEIYYSLYPPGQVCLQGQLYFRAYEVDYVLKGVAGQVRITYHPGDTLSVSKEGVVEPRNFHTKKEFE